MHLGFQMEVKSFIMKAMLKQLFLASTLVLAAAALPDLTPASSFLQAEATSYNEVRQIPALVGIKQGDWIKTGGLATGKMQFTQLSPNHLQIQQQIQLNRFARAAIEQVVERKLSSKTNDVNFRFEVKKQSDGSFAYQLFDQGNSQLLLSGPVKVMVASGSNAQRQVLEFRATLVKMQVTIEPAGSNIKGVAKYFVGPVPVPGNMPFSKL